MTDFEGIVRLLVNSGVRFVLVGGVAASAYGSSYLTKDLDVVYERTPENLKKIVPLLRSINAKLRGAPDDLPFILDERTFAMGLNFTFKTDLGDFDLLGEIAGVGMFKQAYDHSEPVDLYGLKVHILSLDNLIASKKAAGRPKDIAHLKELEAIRKMKKKD